MPSRRRLTAVLLMLLLLLQGELKNAKRMLQDYKDKDLDFGLDAQALSELLSGDKEWAIDIIDAFGSTNGMYVRMSPLDSCLLYQPSISSALFVNSVNALAFICGVCMVCPGSALEKTGRTYGAPCHLVQHDSAKY